MQRFDGSVDHTFEKIDEEVGEIVEKLATFARVISEQNREVMEAVASLKAHNSEKML
jgi:hypothetical protein